MKSTVAPFRTITLALSLLSLFKLHANDFDIFDSPEIDNFIANTTFTLKVAQIPAFDCVTILEEIGVIDLLKEPLYLRTNPLNNRSLLDYPLFNLLEPHPYCKTFGLDFFYNETPAMVFAKDSTKINSYLAVSQQGFIDKLQVVLETIKQLLIPAFDPEIAIDLLSLFENFTVQERRLGVMFTYFAQTPHDYALYVLAPFYYIERNHFTNEQIQRELRTITEAQFGPLNEQQEEELQKRYIISDRLGWGDSRIETYFPCREIFCFCVRPGLYVTLPTAHALEKGIMGSTFVQCGNRPLFDLCLLVNQAAAMEDISEAGFQEYLYCALERLNSLLLQSDLGNKGHVGLGAVLRTEGSLSTFIKRPWAEWIQMNSRISVEYLCPKTEVRSYVSAYPDAGFQGRDFRNESNAQENLDFLVETLTDRLFPYAFPTFVQPGIIVRSTSRFMYEGEKWGYFLGTDFWMQTSETLNNIDGPACLVNQLDVNNAQRRFAYQYKVIGGITYHKEYPTYGYTLSLNGDNTYANSGIGKDFTLTFNVNIHF